jgi:2-dehydro-3-deoxyphosphogluconate aldolase / (4S)-4-hydroxy-2-oxoglutarate aldolase
VRVSRLIPVGNDGPANVRSCKRHALLPPPFPPGAAPVMAILRRLEANRAIGVAKAVREAGISVVEVTVDSAGAFDLVSALATEIPDVVTGVGTVLDAEHVALAADAGARFVVSPNVDEEVISACTERGLPALPGAATASEVVRAWKAGAAAVKLFPAVALGTATVRALREPLPFVPLVAVGGIDGTNAREFLDAGAVAVGLGGWLSCRGDAVAALSRGRQLVSALASGSGPAS